MFLSHRLQFASDEDTVKEQQMGKGAEQHNKQYQCFYNFYHFLMLKQDTFSHFTYWWKCILFEIKIIKEYPIGLFLCRKGYQCFYNFYHYLMLKQDTFSLFTYWRKCILFEIKIIKDYPIFPDPLGMRGFGWGT